MFSTNRSFGQSTEEKNRNGSRVRSIPNWHLTLADGVLLAHLVAPSNLAGLLVILAFAELFRDAAPFQQFFEAPQGRTERLAVVDTHS